MARSTLAGPVIVEGPPQLAATHTLVASLPNMAPSDPHWQNGITFFPHNNVAAAAWDPAPQTNTGGGIAIAGGGTLRTGAGVSKTAPGTNAGVVDFVPYLLESPFECRAVGMDAVNYQERAREQVELGTANGLENNFWTGTVGDPNNFALVRACPDSVATGAGGVLNAGTAGSWTAVAPNRALALLVGALASAGNGTRGMIHAPAQLAEIWAETQALVDSGGQFLTKTREDIIVAGGGYPGTGPGSDGEAGVTPFVGTKLWAYATDMAEIMLSEIDLYPDTYGEAINRTAGAWNSDQQFTFRGERTAAAYTSGFYTFAVYVDLTLST